MWVCVRVFKGKRKGRGEGRGEGRGRRGGGGGGGYNPKRTRWTNNEHGYNRWRRITTAKRRQAGEKEMNQWRIPAEGSMRH